MDWYPGPDETTLFRGPVSYATGRAPKVAGHRWFRDPDGHDIGAELPGWPAAPVHELRGDRAVKAGKGLGILGRVTQVAVIGTIGLLSAGNFNPVGGPGGADKAQPADPALEVEDFPVLVGAFGTAARTLPWALDPDRRAKGNRTDLVLTDHRLLILGVTGAGLTAAEVLWEAPLADVARAEIHAFGLHGGDVTLAFPDGSWTRWDLGSGGSAAKVASVLSGSVTPVELNPVQRAKVDQWTSKLPAGFELVLIDRGEGTVEIETKIPSRAGMVGIGSTLVLDAAGTVILPSK